MQGNGGNKIAQTASSNPFNFIQTTIAVKMSRSFLPLVLCTYSYEFRLNALQFCQTSCR